ncbi:MAG: hypothetical protein FWB72_03605 [Firmicutes bacterium]|nr:hypothetical protein [Bacillota bacterium]
MINRCELILPADGRETLDMQSVEGGSWRGAARIGSFTIMGLGAFAMVAGGVAGASAARHAESGRKGSAFASAALLPMAIGGIAILGGALLVAGLEQDIVPAAGDTDNGVGTPPIECTGEYNYYYTGYGNDWLYR